MKRGWLACLIALAACQLLLAGRLSDEEISEFGGCYFAPVAPSGIWRMRTQDGEIREFEADAKKPGRFIGVGGWWAGVRKDGAISVYAPETDDYPAMVYNFTKGRLSSLDVEGKHCRFNYPNPIVYDDDVIRPLWPDAKKISREEFGAQTSMWKDGRRLTMWFASPNQAGAFLSFVFLALSGVAMMVRFPGKVRVAAVVLSVFALAAIVWTASRGALLGTALGAAAMVVCDGRLRSRFTLKRAAIGFVACAIVAAGMVFVMYCGSRSRTSDAKSDATRIELWSSVPAMMCAAPYGWGGFDGAGRAYSDWFSQKEDVLFRLNLVSDHLTMLVGHGWIGGFAYLFAWFAGLALLGVFAWRGGSAMPLGVWTSLGVGASLNVVMFAPTVLWIPCAVLLFPAFGWKRLDARLVKRCAVFGIAASVAVLGAVAAAGNLLCASNPAVYRNGPRILVNGSTPDIWIVDDEESIGGVLAPRDIREFYSKHPAAPAIGYVKDLSDVPKEGVKRLVLVGDSAYDFMVPYSRDPDSVAVPEELIFLAPQFPPTAIPDELRAKSRVIMVVGEFAARYWEDFAKPADWVGIIPGAEVYIPGWMSQCVESDAKEVSR